MIWKVILSSDIEMCSSDDHSNEQRKTKKDSRRGSYKKKFRCEICGKETTSLGNMKTHMKSKHNMTDLGVKCTNPNESAQQVKEKNGDNENVKKSKI